MSKPFHQIIIPKRGKACSACDTLFEGGMVYHSIIRETSKAGEYERQDVCSACWPAVDQVEVRKVATAAWKSRVIEEEKENKKMPVSQQMMEIFKKALEKKEPVEQVVAYLLGLMLMRGNRFHLKQHLKSHGQRTTLYEDSENEEIIPVPVPEIDDMLLQEAKTLIAERFQP